ncbi:MAG: divalent metal cation transporter [TACK group archaeon]|nr:divalent metal cation transporter [TACK group archaeon]
MQHLSSVGAGLIEGISCVEASMVGTYAYVFSHDGITLLWAVLLPFLFWPFIEVGSSYVGARSHRRFLDLMQAESGPAAASVAGFSLLVSSVSAMVVEVIAASIALSYAVGVGWIFLVPAVLSILFFVPTVSGKHWELLTLLGSVPMLAFPAVAYLRLSSQPSLLSGALSGLFAPKLSSARAEDVAAILGATVAPDALFFSEEAGAEGRVGEGGIGLGHALALVMAISLAIAFSSSGVALSQNSLRGIGISLVPILGSYAYPVFSIGLFSSCISAFAVALRPWLSSLAYLTDNAPTKEEEFLLPTMVLVGGIVFFVGLLGNWVSSVFFLATYDSGIASAAGLIFPLALISKYVVSKKDVPFSVRLFLPIYAGVLLFFCAYGLICGL